MLYVTMPKEVLPGHEGCQTFWQSEKGIFGDSCWGLGTGAGVSLSDFLTQAVKEKLLKLFYKKWRKRPFSLTIFKTSAQKYSFASFIFNIYIYILFSLSCKIFMLLFFSLIGPDQGKKGPKIGFNSWPSSYTIVTN